MATWIPEARYVCPMDPRGECLESIFVTVVSEVVSAISGFLLDPTADARALPGVLVARALLPLSSRDGVTKGDAMILLSKAQEILLMQFPEARGERLGAE